MKTVVRTAVLRPVFFAFFIAAAALHASAATGGTNRLVDSLSTAFDTADEETDFNPEGAGLVDYIARAAKHNPALRAAFYEWVAAEEKTGYSGSLPDPRLMYSYFLENVETRVGPQIQRIQIQQVFPWFGTLGARKDVSNASAKAAYQRFESRKLRLLYEVRSAFNEYYYLGRDIAITRDNLDLLELWEGVAIAKYRVALTRHPDVIKAQLELGKLEDRLRTVEARTYPVEAHLRALLNLPDSVRLAIPEVIEVEEVDVDKHLVFQAIRSDSPELKSALHIIEKNRAAVRLAGKASYPDFVLGFDYIDTGAAVDPLMPESGKDAMMASVGLSLPIWFGANKARKQEALASYRQAQYLYVEAQTRLESSAEKIVFDYEDALRKVRLYRDGLLPVAEQSLNATYTAYQTGETDFLNLLETQRQLLGFQLQYERARSDLATRRAELEMITGSGLSRFVTQE